MLSGLVRIKRLNDDLECDGCGSKSIQIYLALGDSGNFPIALCHDCALAESQNPDIYFCLGPKCQFDDCMNDADRIVIIGEVSKCLCLKHSKDCLKWHEHFFAMGLFSKKGVD